MKKRSLRTATFSLTVLFAAASISLAQAPAKTSPAASKAEAATTTAVSSTTSSSQPNEAEMMKQMMELAKMGENHKLLASLAGTWTYGIKMWMNPDPNAPPTTSTGTAVRKAIMDGRFFIFEVTGLMKMPGADGKMKDTEFKGVSLEGYDNVKKKFVSTWSDNMGTGIFMSEGTYDAASKTFTYTGEFEVMPGTKTKIRELIKVVDNDHYTLEYYEDRGGQEAKTMEITNTRKK